MSVAYERNADLAFDTNEIREASKAYQEQAEKLRTLAKDLDDLLTSLKNEGWTTGAGQAFQEMANVNWEQNIDKYADLLDTLVKILDNSCNDYEDLVENHIDKTKVNC